MTPSGLVSKIEGGWTARNKYKPVEAAFFFQQKATDVEMTGLELILTKIDCSTTNRPSKYKKCIERRNVPAHFYPQQTRLSSLPTYDTGSRGTICALGLRHGGWALKGYLSAGRDILVMMMTLYGEGSPHRSLRKQRWDKTHHLQVYESQLAVSSSSPG